MMMPVYVEVRMHLAHHFIFQGKIWIMAYINGEPSLWREDDIREPILRD